MLNLLNFNTKLEIAHCPGTRAFCGNNTDLPITISMNLQTIVLQNEPKNGTDVLVYELTENSDFLSMLKFLSRSSEKFFTPHQIINFFRSRREWFGINFSHNFFPVRTDEATLDFMVYFVGNEQGDMWTADVLPTSHETVWDAEFKPRLFLPA